MKKDTILVLSSTFPRWENDKEPRFVYDLCIKLKKDFDIIILTPHFENTKLQEKLNNLTIFRYRYAPAKLEKLVHDGGITSNLKKSPWKWLLIPSFFIAQFFAILKLLKQYDINLIHAHWLIPQGFLAVLALKLVKKNRPVLLCTSHGGDLFGLQDKYSQKIKKWVINNSNAITVVSKAMLKPIQNIAPDALKKTQVISMGVDFTNQFALNTDVTRKKSMILFAGRLVEKKGVDTLIKAMPAVLKQFPDSQLVISGDGPEKSFLEKLVKEMVLKQSVFFIGRQDHQALTKLYSSAAISVFPFQQAKNGDIEGLGLVMIEALACGCPVIAGDVPAIHDVIKHNTSGIISPPKNSRLLADNIISLLLSPEKCQQLAKNGREYAIAHFSWEIITQKYINLFNQLTALPRSDE